MRNRAGKDLFHMGEIQSIEYFLTLFFSNVAVFTQQAKYIVTVYVCSVCIHAYYF